MASDDHFIARARQIAEMPIAIPVNETGGYGPDGEVIFTAHPEGTPGILTDGWDGVSATFATNGSAALAVTRSDGLTFDILSESFDRFEKRETGVPSGNVWIQLGHQSKAIASLVNPSLGIALAPTSIRIVKVQRPAREMFYCGQFGLPANGILHTVVRMSLARTSVGPAMVRQVYLHNDSPGQCDGNLWTFFNLHGTQLQPYDMEIWYDMGLPVSPLETVVSCTVPYSQIVQIKRISTSISAGIEAVAATCDYRTFVGDSGQTSLLPDAVKRGQLLPTGARQQLNRFAVPTIAANHFRISLPARSSAVLHQALLYIADDRLAQKFRRAACADSPGYAGLSRSFLIASRQLLKKTPDVARIVRQDTDNEANDGCPRIELPALPAVSEFLNSVAGGTTGLYGRTFGRRIADGVELPFRDRCQDMWSMVKVDPARVRADLVHTFGFMYHTSDRPARAKHRLSLMEKAHGSFPRQYPSLWPDRSTPITNDNRLFSDSGIWLVDALIRYLHETADISILTERVGCVEFVHHADPAQGIRGGRRKYLIVQVVSEILSRYERLCADSPYGLVQIMHGDWCDPVDMFGTDRIGEPARRGHGRGAGIRLSAHVFLSTIAAIELFESPVVCEQLRGKTDCVAMVGRLQSFADRLRKAVLARGWEDTRSAPGFVDAIHELTRNGKRPSRRTGQTGYTLGSMAPQREFDGVPRRVLTSMAFGLGLLCPQRSYLRPVPRRDEKIAALLKTVDEILYHPEVGLKLYSTPLANSHQTQKLVGRMGIIPSGCSENGEYHHAQAMMNYFRMDLPGQQDRAWEHLRAILSTTRDRRLLGPFDSLANSYSSDPADPHFGAGMIFGFSGSADWLIEIIEKTVGLDLNGFADHRARLRVTPRLPRCFAGRLKYSRQLHVPAGKGKFRAIPLSIAIRPAEDGAMPGIRINGRPAATAEIRDLAGMKQLEIEIVTPSASAT